MPTQCTKLPANFPPLTTKLMGCGEGIVTAFYRSSRTQVIATPKYHIERLNERLFKIAHFSLLTFPSTCSAREVIIKVCHVGGRMMQSVKFQISILFRADFPAFFVSNFALHGIDLSQ